MSKGDEHTKQTQKKPGFFDFLRGNQHTDLTEEEIKKVINRNATLASDEKRMINDILDLGDMTVREIMKPRVDMIFVEDVESALTALERMRGTGYSRLPVFHEEVDDVIGIVYYKDLIGPLMDGRINEPVIKFMFEPMYVPESKKVLPLLGELQAAHQQIAIVVDEYGGTDGLVSMEDIVEEIVGEIIDETDLDRDLITLLGVDAWRVDGRFPVEDAVELGWPVTESDDYETIAGWMIAMLDYVPSVGDTLDVDDYTFKIEKMRRSRISTIRVEKHAARAEDAPADE